MRERLMRKCSYCGEEIPIDLQTIGEIVWFDKKYYHKDCFANLCRENSLPTSKKRNKEKWFNALNNINNLRAATIEHLKPMIVEDSVYRLIMDHYKPTMIANYIWIKLDNIYKGTYKDMSRRIPPKHLIDMWERKMKDLDSMHRKMELDGKIMDANQMINYDLSVLINKYDSYLKWLEKQRIIELEKNNADMDNQSIQQIVDQNVIKAIDKNRDKKVLDEIDIAALVDEIFD